MSKAIRILVAFVSASVLCGCLQVVRVPLPLNKYSEDGSVTNRTWTSIFDKRPDLRVFPTVKMRCMVTAAYFDPIDPKLKGRDLYEARRFKRIAWMPLAVVWATAPFDAVVDVLFLPYDIYASNKDS